MKPIITFLCTVLLAIASQVSAQNMSTSFTAVPLPGQPPYPVGSVVVINMNVTNFTNVSSVLFPITYNSAVLRFDSIELPVIPEYQDTMASSHPTPGVIKVTWFPSVLAYPDGFTIPGSSSRLLTLYFTVIGNGTANVNLSPTVPFTPIEVVNANGNAIFTNAIFNSGGSNNNGVSVEGGTTPPPAPLVGFKIIGNTVYAKSGSRVCIPITVNDFDSLISLQYAMHWDNTKLNYECVRGTATNLAPSFVAPAAAPGTLLEQWVDDNLNTGKGVTKADGTRIYDVCFNAIGAPGTESNITFDGLGFNIPPDFTTDNAEAIYSAPPNPNRWMTGGPNGPSGVPSKVFIMADPPANTAVTYTADQDVVNAGAQTCVDIKVKNFTSIIESEFAITYDATKLTYTAPSFPVQPLGLIASNVTHAVASGTGTIKFKWSNAAGVTLADNTTILSICLTAQASVASGTVIPINFTTTACPNPVVFGTYKKDVGGVPYKFENGKVTVESAGPPGIMLTPTPALCSNTASGSIALEPNGSGTYVWSGPGINASNSTVEDPTGLTPGIYNVTVTFTAGGTTVASTTITAPPAITQTNTTVGVTCFGGSDGSIDLTPGGGTSPYTYNWAGPSGFPTTTTQDLVNVKSGNYLVTITDSKQCTFTAGPIPVSSPQPIGLSSSVVVITPVTCFGVNNGAISLGTGPTGGTSPYTYDWSNDGPDAIDDDPKDISNLAAGSYTVIITDSKGCSFIPGTSFNVAPPQTIAVALASKTDVTCFDSATGKAQLNVTGFTAPNFSWKKVSDPNVISSVKDPSNLTAGTYNVTVTETSAGCTASATLVTNVIINNAPSALTLSNTTTASQCFGGTSNGCIDLTVIGGWGNYSYAWSGGSNLPDPCQLSPGTYTVTVTDQGGCTATNTAVVGGPTAAIAMGNPQVTNVTCFGQGNGGICITPSGGNGAPYNVNWSNTPLTGACVGNLPVGTYTPTVVDAQGCTAAFPAVTITGPLTPITLDTNVTAADPIGAIDLIPTGGTPGTPPNEYQYQWSGPNNFTATTQDISGLVAGIYTVIVTDANGCSKTEVYPVNSNAISATVTSVTNSCNNDGCINIAISPSAVGAGPFTLSWAGGSLPPSSNMSPAVCGLAAGAYVVTITSSTGTTTTVTANITQLQQALLSVQNIKDEEDGQSNGSITVTPTNPSTFLWNTGSVSSSLTNLSAGNYSLTVTNSSSLCTAVYNYEVKNNASSMVVQTNETVQPTCSSSKNGAIFINVQGGDGPNYTYLWAGPNNYSATTKNITGLEAGSYSLTVTDESGAQKTHGPIVLTPISALTITNVNEPWLFPGGTQVSSSTSCDGQANVVFSGQVGNATILWSNGVTTPNNTTLCGGAYSVTVTDTQGGCTVSWSDALTAPDPITTTSEIVKPKCAGQKNGSAKIYPDGGIEPYDVVWSNGQSDQLVFANAYSEAVSLEAGIYTVTITDANLATKTASVTVSNPDQMEVTFTGLDPNNFNSCDGERIAFVTGGVDPYQYLWNTDPQHVSGNTQRAEGLCAGDSLYFNVTDANGCSVTVVEYIALPDDGCFKVRPVLTPDEDGNNDFTNITCIETVTHTVEIYNRWGQLVFQTDDYDNGAPAKRWEGRTRNGVLPEGVYFYVLTIINSKGLQEQIKGAINLIK